MTKLHSAAPSKSDGSATEKLRPMAHGQFRLLPVPIRGSRVWNSRVEQWATA